jgi:hypothetical protein
MSSRWTSPRGRLAALASTATACVAAARGGCPRTLDDKDSYGIGGAAPSGGCDVPALLQTTCATAACHSAATHLAGLDLESPGYAQALVGKKGTGCMGTLIDPDNAEASLLYTKLLATPACNARMPAGKTPLDDAQIACVKEWIESLPPGGGAGGAGGM